MIQRTTTGAMILAGVAIGWGCATYRGSQRGVGFTGYGFVEGYEDLLGGFAAKHVTPGG